MAPKRAASGTAPSAIPPSVNAKSMKPSTAASSSIHTDSPLKSYSSTSASNPTPPSSSSATQKPTAATARKPSSSTQGGGAIAEAQDILTNIWNKYVSETPQRVKLIDTFMAFLVALGGIQFVYVVLAGNYVSAVPSRELFSSLRYTCCRILTLRPAIQRIPFWVLSNSWSIRAHRIIAYPDESGEQE